MLKTTCEKNEGVRVVVFNATFNNISVISWGSNRNQAQTLRIVFNPRIIMTCDYIIPCSLREYMPANDKITELK